MGFGFRICGAVLAVPLLLGGSVRLPAQQLQAPVFRSRIDTVRTDVSVIENKTGKPVTDLTQENFRVFEDDVRQTIASFWAESKSDESPAAGAGPHLSRRRRAFVLVFGTMYLEGPIDPYNGALDFVRKRLKPDDLVAVAAWNRVTAFTTDHELVAQVIERLQNLSPDVFDAIRKDIHNFLPEQRPSPATQSVIDAWLRPPTAPDRFLASAGRLLTRTPEQQANQNVSRWDNRLFSYDILKVAAAIEHVRAIDAEKHVILMNHWGLATPLRLINESASGLYLKSREEDEKFARRASDAGVAVDIILTSGNNTVAPALISSAGVAEHSGGQFTSLRTAAQQFGRIDDASRHAYVLGYVSTRADFDGKYRNVKIEVNRKDVTVVYRRGYTASPEPPSVDAEDLLVRTRLNDAAGSNIQADDIKIKIVSSQILNEVGARRVRGDVRINPASLSLVEDRGAWTGTIHLLVLIGDSKGNVVGRLQQEMRLSLSSSSLEQAKREGIPYQAIVPLSGNPSLLKVIAYQFQSDRVGTANSFVR